MLTWLVAAPVASVAPFQHPSVALASSPVEDLESQLAGASLVGSGCRLVPAGLRASLREQASAFHSRLPRPCGKEAGRAPVRPSLPGTAGEDDCGPQLGTLCAVPAGGTMSVSSSEEQTAHVALGASSGLAFVPASGCVGSSSLGIPARVTSVLKSALKPRSPAPGAGLPPSSVPGQGVTTIPGGKKVHWAPSGNGPSRFATRFPLPHSHKADNFGCRILCRCCKEPVSDCDDPYRTRLGLGPVDRAPMPSGREWLDQQRALGYDFERLAFELVDEEEDSF